MTGANMDIRNRGERVMAISETTGTLTPAFSPLLRRYNLEEFWALSDPDGRAHYDLIGGYLFMVPPPDDPHDDLDARLTASLAAFLNANGMPGSIYHPRASIYTDDSYLEPDMMYVSNALRAKMGKHRTSADIVFEYLSRSTANYDRTTKADTYLALGVLELWLVDSETRSIEIRNAAAGKGLPAWERRRYGTGESAFSLVLTGWQVSVDNLFAGL
jgi:Uma2 family endonuclease